MRAFMHNMRRQLKQVFDAVCELMTPVELPKKRSIVFVAQEEKPAKTKDMKKSESNKKTRAVSEPTPAAH